MIDEAHAYRNPETQRAGVLRRLLAGTPPKKLVLLTATPVNNSLWDLYYLLGYFIPNDAEFAASGIPSLKTHFAEAMATDPEDLSPDKLFDVLDGVAVRRTRHFVKKYYPHDTVTIGGVEVPITFPKPEPITVTYDFDAVLPGFFSRFAHALDCVDLDDCEHGLGPDAPMLRLARYTPSLYRSDDATVGEDGEQRSNVRSTWPGCSVQVCSSGSSPVRRRSRRPVGEWLKATMASSHSSMRAWFLKRKL